MTHDGLLRGKFGYPARPDKKTCPSSALETTHFGGMGILIRFVTYLTNAREFILEVTKTLRTKAPYPVCYPACFVLCG